MNENDCILFIDESMARLLIACRRSGSQDIEVIAKITGTTKGQVITQICQAVAVGAIDKHNNISEIAEKCINAIINKRVEELK